MLKPDSVTGISAKSLQRKSLGEWFTLRTDPIFELAGTAIAAKEIGLRRYHGRAEK